MSDSFAQEINQRVADLTSGQQHEVLIFVQSLRAQPTGKEQKRRQALLDLAGSISAEDLEIMKSVIEADCGQIDPNGW